VGAAVLALLVASPSDTPAAEVLFDQAVYHLAGGGTCEIRLRFDMDGETEGLQPPASGLFSTGVTVFFPEERASVEGEAAIALAPELDSNGAGGPALKAVAAGSAGFAGARPLGSVTGYMGSRLATLTLRDKGIAGVYSLTADLFFTEPGMANFVDGDANLLDPAIGFSSALVNHTPQTTADTPHVARDSADTRIAALANDADADGDSFHLVASEDPPHGTVRCEGDEVLYTPDPGYTGPDAFSYTVEDGRGGRSTGQVIVTVYPVIALYPGWNLISFPVSLAAPCPAQAFAGLPVAEYVFGWDPRGYYVIAGELRALTGYWVYVTGANVVQAGADGAPPASTNIVLGRGWNLIGPSRDRAAPSGAGILGAAWAWPGSEQRYRRLAGGGGVVAVGQGVWVLAEGKLAIGF